MSASVLVGGKLFRDPERKLTKGGKPYVSATIRDSYGDNTNWWKVLAFFEPAAEELLALHDGDAISVSGDLKVEAYDRDGGARVSLTVFADTIISAKRKMRGTPKRDSRATNETLAARSFDDTLPDGWTS